MGWRIEEEEMEEEESWKVEKSGMGGRRKKKSLGGEEAFKGNQKMVLILFGISPAGLAVSQNKSWDGEADGRFLPFATPRPAAKPPRALHILAKHHRVTLYFQDSL
jgi:hypothetical protein